MSKKRDWIPSSWLISAISIWILVVARLVVLRHNSFNTFDFDLGIHDQSLWLLAHGKWFNTVCGLNVFGHHAMFMYYFLVPFVWLGAGPHTWNALQVVALGISSIPIFLIARNRLANASVANIFGFIWLLLPSTTYLAFETFHPETMAIPFLLMAYHYCTDRSVSGEFQFDRHNFIAILWLIAAMLWKEDVALAAMGIGVLMLCSRKRIFGLIVLSLSTAYFLIIAIWLVPHFAGSETAYGMLYGELGTTPSSVVLNSLGKPSLFFARLSENNAMGYLGQITSPMGFLPLLAPVTLLIGLPQYFINILSTSDFTWSMMYHYQAIPSVAAIAASIESYAFVRKRAKTFARIWLCVLIISTGVSARSWGMLPFSNNPIPSSMFTERDVSGWHAALERIGPKDIVSAHYSFVPHATHREVIYTFPNPWIKTNFLNSNDKYVRRCLITWIVIEDGSLGTDAQKLLSTLLTNGTFGEAQSSGGVTSYKYTGPACNGGR